MFNPKEASLLSLPSIPKRWMLRYKIADYKVSCIAGERTCSMPAAFLKDPRKYVAWEVMIFDCISPVNLSVPAIERLFEELKEGKFNPEKYPR